MCVPWSLQAVPISPLPSSFAAPVLLSLFSRRHPVFTREGKVEGNCESSIHLNETNSDSCVLPLLVYVRVHVSVWVWCCQIKRLCDWKH